MAGQYMFTFVVLAAALVALPNVAFGTEYMVGDDLRWTTAGDFVAWAKGKTFRVGDKLVFKYSPGSHNVIQVDEDSYKNCKIPQTGQLVSGQDTITLDSPGPKYYICGVGFHCEKSNQKLQINVEAASGGGATEGAKAIPHAPGTNGTSSIAAPTTAPAAKGSSSPSPAPSHPDEKSPVGVRQSAPSAGSSTEATTPVVATSGSSTTTKPAPAPSAGIRSAALGVPVAVAVSMMALVF